MAMAKYYHFDLVWGVNHRAGVRVDEAITRRLVKLMNELDSDAPTALDIYPDSILEWHWRKPPIEDNIVNAIKSLKHDFCYRFVPDGNIHVVKDCVNCDYDGILKYGDFCNAVPHESDWKVVKWQLIAP